MSTAKVVYGFQDGTTDEKVIDGHRVSVQVFADGRGVVKVYDENDNLKRVVMFPKVSYIDKVNHD